MNKTIVVSDEISSKSLLNLKKMGYTILTIKSCNWLEKPVSTHADMFITKIDSKILADSAIHGLFTNFVDDDIMIYCNRGECINKTLVYPQNVGFNCVKIGKNLICNKKHTCKSVIEYALLNNINILDVKQGYAKCSTCVISDNAIITEDESIYKCAIKNNIDVLKIRKGFVKLSGYDYGFIGGSSGLIEKNLIAFNGNIFLHPDGNKIHKFCYDHSVGIISLCSDVLHDIGSIIRIC